MIPYLALTFASDAANIRLPIDAYALEQVKRSQMEEEARYYSRVLSIGLPTFNGERSIRRAVESLLNQTHKDFELLISDDASSDATEAICRDFASRDTRVIFFRNSANLGVFPNTLRILELASGEFFMWAAQDDFWEPSFVEKNLEKIRNSPRPIASVSRVRFEHAGAPVPFFGGGAGTFPLLGSVRENVYSFLRSPGCVSRLYAIHRRGILLRCWPRKLEWGSDMVIVLRSLAFEGYAETEEVLLTREVKGTSSDIVGQVKRLNPAGIGRMLPLWSFTREALSCPHVPKTPRTFAYLFLHNASHAYMLLRERLRARFPRFARLLPFLGRHGLSWRTSPQDR